MKKLLLPFISVLMTAASAAAEDPAVYLRGDVSGGWSVNETFRFNLENGVYTLHVDHLEGEFKIATDDWVTVDYGAASPAEQTISSSTSLTLQRGGLNFKCPQPLEDVTFSFTNNPDGNSRMTVTVGGQPPVTGISGTLPVLYINVYTDETKTLLDNEIISKDLDHKNYFSNAEYWLDLNGCQWMEAAGAKSIGSAEAPLPLEIKARGNWTRIGFSKKPFKLKLGSKEKMLGLTKSKHFALLAHADDNYGYLRNFTGFNLGRRIGLPWTPGQQPVEVVINGDYRGLYFLTESIRIEKDRINIAELDDNATDPALASGGYLVELDNYDGDNQIRMAEKVAPGVNPPVVDMLRVTWDTPEEYSEIQKRFVTDQFTAMNDAVGTNSDDTWSYLDLDDAVRYYIVEEIISHVEAYHGSTYLFRDRGEGQKWHFSPLWDCGNAFNGTTDGFFYNHTPFGATWIPSMRANARFNDKLAETWMWFMTNGYDGLTADIETYVDHIAEAAKADRRRWQGQPTPAGGQPVADNSDIQPRKEAVLNHLERKLAFLRSQFGDYTALTAPAEEPVRDATPAAPLPDYIESGVEDVSADSADTDAPAEYFDITGRPVTEPAPGSIVIERRGSSVRKVRF